MVMSSPISVNLIELNQPLRAYEGGEGLPLSMQRAAKFSFYYDFSTQFYRFEKASKWETNCDWITNGEESAPAAIAASASRKALFQSAIFLASVSLPKCLSTSCNFCHSAGSVC